jgi:hypothetical protein
VAVATLAIGLVDSGVAVGALAAVSAAGVLLWNVITMSLRQALIPQELFGRVQGGYRTLVWGSVPIGALLGGVLAAVTSVPTVFVVAGSCQLVMGGVLWRLLAGHRETVAGVFPPERETTAVLP